MITDCIDEAARPCADKLIRNILIFTLQAILGNITCDKNGIDLAVNVVCNVLTSRVEEFRSFNNVV